MKLSEVKYRIEGAVAVLSVPFKNDYHGVIVDVDIFNKMVIEVNSITLMTQAGGKYRVQITIKKAYRHLYNVDNRFQIYLHRYIINPSKDKLVDHRNGNPLNNLKENLREATHQQNMENRTITQPSNKSGYRNVYYHKGGRTWAIKIQKNGRHIHFYGFNTAEEAAAVAEVKRKELLPYATK